MIRNKGLVLACLVFPAVLGAQSDASPSEAEGEESKDQSAPRDGTAAQPSTAKRAAKRPDQFLKASEALLEHQRKLRALERETVERRRSLEARLAEITQEKQSVERSNASVAERVEALEKELEAKKSQVAKEEAAALELGGQAKQVVEAAKRFVQRLERHIDDGIPWMLKERKATLEPAKQAAGSPVATPGSAFLAAVRAFEAEEALGRTLEPGRVAIDSSGEERLVPALRLGLLALAYCSNDGALLGYAHSGQKLEEGKIDTGEEGAKDVKQRAMDKVKTGYFEALAVLQRKLSPRLVDFYIATLPVDGEERR